MKTPRKIGRARQLRRTMTLPEIKLWQSLRARPDGLRFRRQHPIGLYIADFYCPAARLVIEVDGAIHDINVHRAGDEKRDEWMAMRAADTLRIRAKDVLSNSDEVVRLIVARCRERSVRGSE